MTPVTARIDSPAAWRGQELAGRDDWKIELRPEQVDAIDACIIGAEESGRPLTALTRDDFPLAKLEPLVDEILECMENGRGFIVLRGLPVERWGETRSRIALWGLGTHLGWAEPQDGAGSLMHDVRDIGREFGSDDEIRYFQTSQAIDMHTDGADVFALCCLHQGRSGGRSRIVSAVEVFNVIVERRPDLAAVLQAPFHFDARGQRADGARCQIIPIYAFEEGQPSIIFKLAYIHSAQRFEDVPRLTGAQREALAMLSAVLEEDGMALEFDLEPGEVVVASNHVVLHGRTAYEDADDAAQKRHMIRLWLTIPNGRPLPPHYADTREFAATYARRVR